MKTVRMLIIAAPITTGNFQDDLLYVVQSRRSGEYGLVPARLPQQSVFCLVGVGAVKAFDLYQTLRRTAADSSYGACSDDFQPPQQEWDRRERRR